MSPDTLAIMGALLGAADMLSTLVILAGVLQLAGPFRSRGLELRDSRCPNQADPETREVDTPSKDAP